MPAKIFFENRSIFWRRCGQKFSDKGVVVYFVTTYYIFSHSIMPAKFFSKIGQYFGEDVDKSFRINFLGPHYICGLTDQH